MKRIIVELDDHVADKTFEKYSKDPVPVGEFGNGRIIEIYTPIAVLPKEIQKIRDAVREIGKSGLTGEMIKTYICTKRKVAGDKYDTVVKGLADIINSMEKERIINKLKE